MRETKTGRRGVSFDMNENESFNAEISGIEEAVRKFDRMVKESGTNRSHVVRRFVEECAKEGRLLLPEYANAPRGLTPEISPTPAPRPCGYDLFAESAIVAEDEHEQVAKSAKNGEKMTFADDFCGTVTV